VWDREERRGIGGEHGFFLAEVVDPDREDRSVGRSGITEPFDVGLAERPLPREALLADEPGAISVTLAFGDLWKLRDHLRDVVEGDHGCFSLRECNPPIHSAESLRRLSQPTLGGYLR
jgi:hypothetical protein